MNNSAIIEDTNSIRNNKWPEKELKHVKFRDKRLNNRLIKTGKYIEGKASGSINQSRRDRKDAKGAYRLFSNEKVEVSKIYVSHYKETYNMEKGNNFIFTVQDTTYLDYDIT